MYEARDILAVLLSAGVCDIDFLLNKINELDVEFYDIDEEVKSWGKEGDFNSYVYCTFYSAGYKFLDSVKEYVENYNEELLETYNLENIDQSVLEDFDIKVYVNFLDSSFDCILENYDVTDDSEENIIRFLEELYQLELLAS